MTTTMQTIGLVLFVMALLHTFSTHLFEVLAHRHPRHAGLFHLLGEVEVVFGFWAFVLMVFDGPGRGQRRRSTMPNRATTPSRCSCSS
jgi:hypothetical protein